MKMQASYKTLRLERKKSAQVMCENPVCKQLLHIELLLQSR